MKTSGIYLFLVAIFVACGTDDPLDAAWQLFREGNYAEAHAEFTELIPSEGAQAFVGLGWTALKMDSVSESSAYFNTAIATKDSILDAVAGNVFVLWKLGAWQGSIVSANNVLTRKPAYVFTHDRTVTHHDLNVHKAYSQFDLGRLSNCLATIQILDPTFTIATSDSTGELLAKLELLYDQYK